MKRATVLSLAAVSAAVACHSDRSIAPNPAAGRPGISAALVDGSHGGNPHFFFLPPMVPPPPPRFSGIFDPTLTPDVKICTVQTNGACPEVAHFTTPPPGTPFNPFQVFNRVQVIKNLQFYFVLWRPNWQTLDPTQIQRLRVSVGTATLGLADVKVVSSEDEFEAVWASKQFVPLIRGGLLLIIFRIEQGAVGAGPPGCNGQQDCTQVSVGPNPTQRVDVVTPSGQAAASFPPGYFTKTVTLTIHQVLEGEGQGCFSASTPPRPLVFGCYSYATSPQQLGDVLGCKTEPSAAKCARVEVCPTLAPTDPRHQHLQLFRSDPEQAVRPLEGEVEGTLVTCPPLNLGLGGAHGVTDLARAGWRSLMTALGELVTPKSLFAASAMIHRGVGGLTCCFSNIGWALPLQMTTVPGTDKQTAPAGTAVALDPAVLVEFLHPTIAPAPGIDVTFGPVNGTVSATLVTTGGDGIAATHWTLGATPGPNLLVASAPANGSPDSIHATGITPVPWLRVGAGNQHTCAFTTAGVAYCWGQNGFGQLGTGGTTASLTPTLVTGEHTWTSIAATGAVFTALDQAHTCGATTGNTGYCWGAGAENVLGNGSTADQATPTVVAGQSFSSMSVNVFTSCGVTPNNAAYCWGLGVNGRLGTGDVNGSSTPALVAGEHQFGSVSVGGDHTCGVTVSGDAYCWGNNRQGQLGRGGDPADLSNPNPTSEEDSIPILVTGGFQWLSVSTGNTHTCGVTTQNLVYCWGNNQDNRLGAATTQLCAGLSGPTTTLPCSTSPLLVSGGLNFSAVSAGTFHTCALTTGGAAYCWGSNNFGSQLGTGSSVANSATPVPVAGTNTFLAIGAGSFHTCAVRSDNALFCWGKNDGGQLGDGTTTDRSTPVGVHGP